MIVYSTHLLPVEALSRGEESEVWLARDRVGGHKVVHKRLTQPSPFARELLIERVRLSQRLRHSGFLAAEDLTVESGGFAGFTTRPIRRASLDQIRERFGDPGLLSVLWQVSWGMENLHRLDFVHCDLKPANVLIESGDRGPVAWISDLDWAVRRGVQRPLTFRGTPPYAAPEVSQGRPLDEAADLFSFGQILLLDIARLVLDETARARLWELGEQCTQRGPDSRFRSFGAVRNEMVAIQRLYSRCPPNPELLPAVRDAGLRSRVAALTRLSTRTAGSNIWITAPPGGGKSRVMREACFQQQMAGRETLRVEGVRSLKELSAALRQCSQELRSQARLTGLEDILVFAESDPDANFSDQHWPGLAGVRLFLESRSFRHRPTEAEAYDVPSWTQRECIAAIGHFHDNAPLANINGEALRAASGGIPGVALCQLRAWMRLPRKNLPLESLNIDRLDRDVAEYWMRRHAVLTKKQQELLQRAAVFHDQFMAGELPVGSSGVPSIRTRLKELCQLKWLTHDEVTDRHRVVSRSARNFIRSITPPDQLSQWAADALALSQAEQSVALGEDCRRWELMRLCGRHREASPPAGRGNFTDTKLETHARLGRYRSDRKSGKGDPAETALALSRAFGRLGSTIRQARWATAALRHMSETLGGAPLSLESARLHCELYQLAVPPEKVGECIEGLLGDGMCLTPAVQGYLLSELGASHLWMTRHALGGELCLQAHHLLQQCVPDSEEYARNLNRLGLASSRAGRNESARKYLQEALRLAADRNFVSVGWRCHGNLGVVARDLGDPEFAMDCSRHVMRHCRETGQVIHYLSALMNRALYFVDLGHGNRAARAARLSVALAEMLGDSVQMGHTTNNLGWILTMQGEAGAAYKQLRESIRLRRRVGDDAAEAHALLNLAWLAIMVRYPNDAEALAASTLGVWERENHQHGHCEAQLIRAAAAMQSGDDRTAERHLRNIPLDDPGLSPRDRAETEIALARLLFAKKHPGACAAELERLRGRPPILAMNPLYLEFRRLEGLSLLYSGDRDHAFEVLGATAQACRVARRVDRLLETMGAQIELAIQMGNRTVARRYLSTAQGMINEMRRELPCHLIRNE